MDASMRNTLTTLNNLQLFDSRYFANKLRTF